MSWKFWLGRVVLHFLIPVEKAISYPESSGSLVSGWAPGETLGDWNFITAGFGDGGRHTLGVTKIATGLISDYRAGANLVAEQVRTRKNSREY